MMVPGGAGQGSLVVLGKLVEDVVVVPTAPPLVVEPDPGEEPEDVDEPGSVLAAR